MDEHNFPCKKKYWLAMGFRDYPLRLLFPSSMTDQNLRRRKRSTASTASLQEALRAPDVRGNITEHYN
jgi:hypothetical protein